MILIYLTVFMPVFHVPTILYTPVHLQQYTINFMNNTKLKIKILMTVDR